MPYGHSLQDTSGTFLNGWHAPFTGSAAGGFRRLRRYPVWWPRLANTNLVCILVALLDTNKNDVDVEVVLGDETGATTAINGGTWTQLPGSLLSYHRIDVAPGNVNVGDFGEVYFQVDPDTPFPDDLTILGECFIVEPN